MYLSSIIYGLIITLCLPNMAEGITVFIAKSIYNEYRVNTLNINVYKHWVARGIYNVFLTLVKKEIVLIIENKVFIKTYKHTSNGVKILLEMICCRKNLFF